VHVDVRRIPARQLGAEVAQGTLDFGVLTFQPAEAQLGSIVLGHDELVMLVHPSHPLAHSREVTLSECARQTVIAHNDPSHVRDRVLRLFEQHHIPANILVSLPSLEGIKRAVAMQMGVAMLPAAAPSPRSSAASSSRWPCRKYGCAGTSGSCFARPASDRHAATAFLTSVEEKKKTRSPDHEEIEDHEEPKPKKVAG
jgi:DNA-binding transcriptional LysR family regulator